MAKTTKKITTSNEIKVTLDTICGYKEEKKEILNIIRLLNNHKEYSEQGVNIPRGLIFQGPPGTGKTLFAKAIANECAYGFFVAFDGEIEENYLDTLKKVFKQAEKYSKDNNAPALIYIDEIDKLTYTDSYGQLADSDAREATRFLLQKLDETNFKNKILVIASTNNYGRIPEALLRSGRFDKKFLIDLPDAESRRDILEFYINKHPMFKNIDINVLALKTAGMSGADLKTLINNTLIEYITSKEVIEIDDFLKIINEMSFDTIGKKWKDSKNALEVLAHEVGHLIVAHETSKSNYWGNISALRYGDTYGHTRDEIEVEWAEEPVGGEPSPNCYLRDEDYTTSEDLVISNIVSIAGGVSEYYFTGRKSIGMGGDLIAIRRNLSILTSNGYFGFKDMCDTYNDFPTPQQTLLKIKKRLSKIVRGYYKKALKIIKKNRVLCLYLIDETHKNNDALSGAKIKEKVAYFKVHKREMYKKYHKATLDDLK